MKQFTYHLTYRDLAKLFVTSTKQVTNYIQRKKFKTDDLISIFTFYLAQKEAINRRQEQWNDLFEKYKKDLLILKSPEMKFVEDNLKDWDRKSELIRHGGLFYKSRSK